MILKRRFIQVNDENLKLFLMLEIYADSFFFFHFQIKLETSNSALLYVYVTDPNLRSVKLNCLCMLEF